jgi:hypothetical protein
METLIPKGSKIMPALAPGYAHYPITSSGVVIGRKT